MEKGHYEFRKYDTEVTIDKDFRILSNFPTPKPNPDYNKLEKIAQRMADALELISMNKHECVFSDPVDYKEIANCMIGISNKALAEWESFKKEL